MDISLSPSLEHFVQEKIENGGYQSANEVISDALRLLQERERPREELIEQLRRTIDLQISDTPFSQVVAQALRHTWTRDPFDRIITAQAALGQHRLLTKDRTIRDHYQRAYWP